MNKIPVTHDPTAALQAAISVLEAIARKEESLPIKRVKQIISSIFSRKAREQYKRKHLKVQNAILTLQNHHQLIFQLQKGDVADRKLAESAFAALKHHRIEVPHYPVIHTQIVADNRISKTFKAHIQPAIPDDLMLARETDLIRIKANTLLQRHGITFSSQAEKLASIKSASIHFSVDPASKISTLCLILENTPNQTIKISGSFKREHKHTIPLPDSFQLVKNEI